jgi:hypothetical protein
LHFISVLGGVSAIIYCCCCKQDEQPIVDEKCDINNAAIATPEDSSWKSYVPSQLKSDNGAPNMLIIVGIVLVVLIVLVGVIKCFCCSGSGSKSDLRGEHATEIYDDGFVTDGEWGDNNNNGEFGADDFASQYHTEPSYDTDCARTTITSNGTSRRTSEL